MIDKRVQLGWVYRGTGLGDWPHRRTAHGWTGGWLNRRCDTCAYLSGLRGARELFERAGGKGRAHLDDLLLVRSPREHHLHDTRKTHPSRVALYNPDLLLLVVDVVNNTPCIYYTCGLI